MRSYGTKSWLAPVIALALMACSDDGPAGPGGNGNPADQEFEWAGSVAAGQMIEIKGINGSISAAHAAGNQIEVLATKQGHGDDPANVDIEVLPHGDGVTICAVYPDVPGETPNECGPGLAGNMTTRDIDVEVTFIVRVPAGVRFVGRTIAGDVIATGLDADAYGHTVSGNVELSTSAMAEGATVSGSVSATLGEANPSRTLAFTTVSGDVTVRIPAATNARVQAATANGSVSSDFPLTRNLAGSWEGTLGNGGAMLLLSSVNGDVRLRRGS